MRRWEHRVGQTFGLGGERHGGGAAQMTDRRTLVRESGVAARPKVAQKVRAAAIWKTPRSSLALILSVEALCVTWIAVANFVSAVDVTDLWHFALLLGVNLAYAE